MANENNEYQLAEAARLFHIFSEPARLKILRLLRHNARCGRELAKELQLTPATTCHHLDRLKEAHLLEERRSGKRVYYSIIDSEFSRALERSMAVLQGNHGRPSRQESTSQAPEREEK